MNKLKIGAMILISAVLLAGCTSGSSSTTRTNITGKTFTMAEVATHNTPSDCYMVINGNVYDASSFINQHPGGSVITQGCGIDASSMFNSVHNSRGTSTLSSLLIGALKS